MRASLQSRLPPLAPPGNPATLRGRPGLQTDQPPYIASVELENGHLLVVAIGSTSDAGPEANLIPSEVVKIINELRIGPDPDTRWLKL